nr:MAG: hypothetical protein [Bacteriophage sp.]
MERKIGEIFTCDGKTYQVIKGIACNGCVFIKNGDCYSLNELLGPCDYTKRTDKTDVIFKEINNMEIKNNQLTIDIPKGMKIDLENSDLAKGIVKFKKDNITYKNIEDTLNLEINSKIMVANINNISKLRALNKLMNIAKYYNGDWKPNWSDQNYFIIYKGDMYKVNYNWTIISNNIYFKNEKDAQAVIDNPNFRDILDAIYKN